MVVHVGERCILIAYGIESRLREQADQVGLFQEPANFLGSVAAAVQTTDQRAHAGSQNHIDGNSFCFKGFQHSNMGKPAGAAAAEYEDDCRLGGGKRYTQERKKHEKQRSFHSFTRALHQENLGCRLKRRPSQSPCVFPAAVK
ncbi:hypothetical protein DSECCO2_513690 [anaerobic digester metagenome]